MLRIYYSNHLEELGYALSREATVLQRKDPLQSVTVIVPNHGLGRWLKAQIAISNNVCANIDCQLPSSFLWKVVQGVLPQEVSGEQYEREAMKWHFYDMLADLEQLAQFPPLLSYLAETSDQSNVGSVINPLKLFHLCSKLAGIFDAYQIYRPDWIRAWSKGDYSVKGAIPKEFLWQGELWLQLSERVHRISEGKAYNRVEIFDQWGKALQQQQTPLASLKQEIFFFAVSFLPPAQFSIFTNLSRYQPMTWFCLSPCREYWADLISERRRLKIERGLSKNHSAATPHHYEVGNSLLASWGQVGQDFHEALSETAVDSETDLYREPAADSLLHTVQRDIVTMNDLVFRRNQGKVKELPEAPQESRSIAFHSCYSPMREVQVLHDQILAMLAEDESLQPRDIAVVIPKLENYAPYIQAVFSSSPRKRHVPFVIVEQNKLGRQRIFRALLSLFELPEWRFGVNQIHDFLRLPPVQRRFGLSDDDAELIKLWCSHTNIRWGLDESDWKNLGLKTELNTWRFGLKRLYMGLLYGDVECQKQVPAPYADIRDTESEVLAKLANFIDTLDDLRSSCPESASISLWWEWFRKAEQKLFIFEGEEEQSAQRIYRTLADLEKNFKQLDFSRNLERSLVQEMLQKASSQDVAQLRLFSGEVTFCDMVPLRAIPYRVVCLLGMNEVDFPRREEQFSFDLLTYTPRRRGDRCYSMVDRYLFLELLLSARHMLYISYVGKDIRENTNRPVSSVVSELMEYLDGRFQKKQDERLLSERLTTVHPLHPFSSHYLHPRQDGVFTYAAEWFPEPREPSSLNLNKSRAQSDTPASLASQSPLENRLTEFLLELADLKRFFQSPVRWFFESIWGVKLMLSGELKAQEPDYPELKSRYAFRKTLVKNLAEDRQIDDVYQRVKGEGILPLAPFDRYALNSIAGELEKVVAAERRLVKSSAEEREIEITLGEVKVVGKVEGILGTERVLPVLGRRSERQMWHLWIDHLALNAQEENGPSYSSLLVAKDSERRLNPIPSQDARQILRLLIDVYREGCIRPLPFFPATSLRYKLYRENKATLSSVLQTFGGQTGDGRCPYVSMTFTASEIFGEGSSANLEFRELAESLCHPLTVYAESVKNNRAGR